MSNPLEIQIGGDHYKKCAYQPVVLNAKLNFNFIQGSMNKYLSRYKNKNGLQDLEKVVHYARLGQELQPRNFYLYGEESAKEIHRYVVLNNFQRIEEIIFAIAAQNWNSVLSKMKPLIKEFENNK